MTAPSPGAHSVKRNLIANFLGKFWAACISLVFIPVYIRFIGIESFGLVGFYATLLAMLSVFDLGLSTTLNREMARLSALPDSAREMRDLLKTLQSVYWAGALLIVVAVVLLAPVISRHWVNTKEMSISTVEYVVMLMGGAIAFQMLFGFYSGGLLGLQRQVAYNALNASVATLRAVGAIGVLAFISPTVAAYFLWQVACSMAAVILVSLVLWNGMAATGRPASFRPDILASLWRFIAGMSATSVVGILLNQTDKLVLSKMLSLDLFGYYALAGTVAAGLQYLGSPVFTAFFPSFTHHLAKGDDPGLKGQYHKAAQVLSVVVLPVAGVLVFFPEQVMLAWTMNPVTVANTHEIVRLLSLGTAMNLLASIPYGLQLAHRWTRLAVFANAAAAVILLPSLFFAIRRYGAVGAAGVWVVLNAGYVFVYVQVMHRRILPGEQKRWYYEDVLPTAAAVSLVGAIALLLVRAIPSRVGLLLQLGGVYAAMAAAAVVATPKMKDILFQAIVAKRLV